MKIESPVLRRLGPVPFWRGSVKCLEGLQGIYRKASVAASTKLGRSAADQNSPKTRLTSGGTL